MVRVLEMLLVKHATVGVGEDAAVGLVGAGPSVVVGSDRVATVCLAATTRLLALPLTLVDERILAGSVPRGFDRVRPLDSEVDFLTLLVVFVLVDHALALLRLARI